MKRNSIKRLGRGIAVFLSAGVMLQAGGCLSNPSELVGGLVTSVVNNALASFIFGSFGLAA
jgi:hypothetical protein